MITEDYVSFETAKLLKEKGFNEPCIMFWQYDKANDEDDTDGISLLSWNEDDSNRVTNSELDDYFYEAFASEGYSAPTLQMAMKWLREVHKIAINIGWGEVFEENYQWWCIILNQNSGEILRESEYCETYEKACETAVKYCLENLI